MKGTKTLLSYLIFLIGLQWKTVYVVNAEECGVNYFKCKKNGKCILSAFRCDGENDCDEEDGDHSDEENCEKKPVAECSLDFRCKNGKCIPKSYTCDFMDDCGDNSDESTTDGPLCASSNTCPSGMFKCKKSGKCIYQSYVCDGEGDCGDEDDSDEKENCDTNQCTADEFKCSFFRCIDKEWRCDGTDDCGDNSDERNCTASTTPTTTIIKSTINIPKTVKTSKSPGLIKMALNCNLFSFFCPNDHRCIQEEWICDGMIDCRDGHDESPEICKKTCKENEFTCPDGACILESQKCDGIKHCPNGEDEDLPQCDVSVQCTNGTYKCQNSEKCLSEENICDRIKHCPNGDDEGQKCGVNECTLNNAGCSHHCVDLKVGHICKCPYGFKLKSDNKTCEDINECLMSGICSQFCVNEDSSYRCECDEGYELLPDKKTCRVKAPLPYLMFSNGKEIREISTNFHDYKSVIKKTEGVAAIDADINNGMIYWADGNEGAIKRAPKDGSKNAEVVVSNVSPASLTLDWISQKLYWVDKEMNKISVSNLDGSHIKTLLQGNNNDKFESLDVMPEKGMLYFTNHGSESKIENVLLDGSKRNVIGTHGVTLASLVTIDRVIEKIYWINTDSAHIMSSNLDGTNINTVKKLHETVVNGLTVFEDNLYFTSKKLNHIYKINKYTGKSEEKVNKFDNPGDIMVYHPVVQKKVFHPCQKSNGNCSHLCFVSDVEQQKYFCDCPDTMKLYTDRKTCIPKEIHQPISVTKCVNGYSCKVTKQCIPQRLVCNGMKNCAFNDDEMNCVETKNQPAVSAKHIKSSKVNIFIIVGASVGVFVIFVIIIAVWCQYRKKSHQTGISMVFEKDNEVMHVKNYNDKIDVVKYVPNTLKKKVDSRNYDESNRSLYDTNEGECMVDQADSSNSSSLNFDESQPIIS